MIVKLEAENHQVGVVADAPQRLPGKARNEPVVPSGDTAVHGRGDLQRAADGQSLVVREGSLPTIEDLPAG